MAGRQSVSADLYGFPRVAKCNPYLMNNYLYISDPLAVPLKLSSLSCPLWGQMYLVLVFSFLLVDPLCLSDEL